MITISSSDIVKKPSYITQPKDITFVEDAKKHITKSVVIPAKYIDLIKEKLEDIEYELWLKRNEKGLAQDLDGLFDEATGEIGDKL